MLIADLSLACRIEAAERELSQGLAELALRAGEDAFATPIGGGVAVYGGEGSPFNKVIGVGLAGPIEEAAFAAIERDYAARGAAVQVELATLADPAVASMLTRRGYALVGFEDVLGQPLAPATTEEEAGVIEIGEARDLAAWGRLVCAGFSRPDLGAEGGHPHESFEQAALERVLLRFSAAPGVRCFLARCAGEPAGGGSMRIAGRVAQLCGASTLPEFRRRGVQTALLRARLAHAARAGCELATMTTLPGTRSQHNARRQGFALLYTRAILVKPPVTAHSGEHS